MNKQTKQLFRRQEVILDDGLFEDCSFEECVMVYSGGPVAMIRPTIHNCRWRFEKAASRTLEFLKGLHSLGQSAAMEELFKDLRPSSEIKVF